MKRVTEIKKQTDNRFLNMYELTSVHRDGSTSPYFMASRNSDPETLKLRCEEKPADAVMIVALKDGKMVLEKQYRYPLDDYIYEFPAGLCEKGEDLLETAKREFFEETGMTFEPVTGHNSSRPYYTSIGLSDEAISTVYGYASGEATTEHQEQTEDINVVFADRDECRRILQEEHVTIMCALILMHYINSEEDNFDKFLV
ncbi:MAG: NUDIX hydrolase [Firmicutes bacterium]|nr:NUDIX hydrolase [Bacillota bacterium]